MDDYDQENRTYSEDKVLSRKSKKPLMEKRRRQRINNCLTQLKSLVLQAMKKDTTHYSKLEKADILEMTVKYLRSLQRRQITSAAVADPSVAAKYAVGFHECASEVARYLGNAQGINEDVRGRLLGHLTNCVQGSNTQQQIPQCQTYMQPLHVQIPSSQNGHGLSQVTSDSLLLPQQNGFIQSVSRTNSIPSSGMQLSGTFQVVQDNVYNGSTSLYPGRSNDVRVLEQKMTMQPCSLPTQRSNSDSGRQQLQLKMCKSDDSYMITESSRRLSTVNESKMHLPGLSSSPGYASASSALKEERLWRPW